MAATKHPEWASPPTYSTCSTLQKGCTSTPGLTAFAGDALEEDEGVMAFHARFSTLDFLGDDAAAFSCCPDAVSATPDARGVAPSGSLS